MIERSRLDYDVNYETRLGVEPPCLTCRVLEDGEFT